jgi:adenine-specific DNA-methyltransferase
MEANKEQGYNRRFIICEQLDEHIEVIKKRLNAVFRQDGFFASPFVYCELAKCNQNFIDKTTAAKTDKELIALLDEILATGFISHKVFPADISEAADEFAALSLADKKRFILELLDKNMLYVNLYDMNDKDYAISKEDKAFTASFYKKEGK